LRRDANPPFARERINAHEITPDITSGNGRKFLLIVNICELYLTVFWCVLLHNIMVTIELELFVHDDRRKYHPTFYYNSE